MPNESTTIVQKLYSYCHVLREVGMSYLDYVEQITYLLFLKMVDETTKPPFNKKSNVPEGYDWQSLMQRDGDDLEKHYRDVLQKLGKEKGLLGFIFRKSLSKFQEPALLRRVIADLIDKESWMTLDADVKGDAYEGLLAKGSEDIKSGAGQYFTPRPLIKAVVDVMRPEPGMTICDPACGTGGFLLAAYEYLANNPRLDKDQKNHLKYEALHGWELVDTAARLCVMNLYLHGIGGDNVPIRVVDSLKNDPGVRFDMVLTNPPFGKKSSIKYFNDEGECSNDNIAYSRDDFWTTTKNKQLNFVQHVKTILSVNGRAAMVVPDNVLFEGGAGETIRRKLLHEFDVHTLLRLPTGVFYAQGVKANVIFFDKKPGSEKAWTSTLWIYDFRTNMNFTLKTNPLKRADLDDFVKCYNPANRHNRKESERFRPYKYEELLKRDKVSLDIFWLKDDSLEDSDNLPPADILAAEIAADLEAALEQFSEIANDLKG